MPSTDNKNTRDNKSTEAENTNAAYQEAQKDIEKDADLNPGDPAKDLDEGEYARLKDGDS